MQLWNKVQYDLILQDINQDLRQKEEEFEMLEATLPTLVLAKHLTWLRTSHALQADIDELRQKKKVLGDRLKPWDAKASSFHKMLMSWLSN